MIKISLILVFQIILEALSDGIYDNQKKRAYHAIKFASYMILLIPMIIPETLGLFDLVFCDIQKRIYLLISYPLFRFAIFDLVYNVTRGLPVLRVGSTASTDIFFRQFIAWSNLPQNHVIFWLKLFCLIGAFELSGIFDYIEYLSAIII